LRFVNCVIKEMMMMTMMMMQASSGIAATWGKWSNYFLKLPNTIFFQILQIAKFGLW